MIGKSVFVWNTGSIYAGNVTRIAETLKAAGFQSAMLHYQTLTGWRHPARVALITALRGVGIEPIGSAAVYGTNPKLEGQQAALLCQDYDLKAFVFDAEQRFDDADPSGNGARVMLESFRQESDAGIGWCWWARYKNPANGQVWHPVAVLRAAMTLADFGVPMMYWQGSSPSGAVVYAQQSVDQWRAVTNKPLVPAGRAYDGDGGTVTAAAMQAFVGYFEPLYLAGNIDGITWWSMEHALDTGVWDVFSGLPSYGEDEPGEPEEGKAMNGIVLTDESNLIDAQAVKAAGYEFAYVRKYKTMPGGAAAGKDDQRVSQHKTALSSVGLRYGVFGDFDHRDGIEGSAQAAEIVGYGNRDDALPPALRLWEVKGADGKPLAISNWHTYTNRLAEVCYHIWVLVGRFPVILANQNQIRQITAQLSSLSLDSRDALQKSWWGVIGVPGQPPTLPSPWTRYPFFAEFVADGQTVSGAIKVAIAHWPGTAAELDTWVKNPTLANVPAWGEIVEPEPEPKPDPEVPPAEKTLEQRVKVLEDENAEIIAALQAQGEVIERVMEWAKNVGLK